MASYPRTSSRIPRSTTVRDAFDDIEPLTVGIEEEAMLLDRGTLEPLPRAHDVLARLDGDHRFKPELPAAQLEIVLPPTRTVPETARALVLARRELAAAADGVGRLAAAGGHPLARPRIELSRGEPYGAIAREYGPVAALEGVCALQVHVAVGGHDRTLGVYNALRSHLPELAALAANAPFYAGEDSGLASVRPKLAELLPRQGVPPAFAGWDEFAGALAWGEAAGALPVPGHWWWELRPHPRHGTLELRVPDAQSTVADAMAVAAFAHALVGWLAERHDAGDLPGPDPTWRIEENRWRACRHGLDAELADLRTGEREPARALLARRVDDLAPVAEQLGCALELEGVRALLGENGAERMRRAGDARAATEQLVREYLP